VPPWQHDDAPDRQRISMAFNIDMSAARPRGRSSGHSVLHSQSGFYGALRWAGPACGSAEPIGRRSAAHKLVCVRCFCTGAQGA
jgi:hypothetical protein